MKLRLNGEECDIEAGTTVSALLAQRKINPSAVVCEVNLTIICTEEREYSVLNEGDVVEILHFVGGGCGDTCSETGCL